MSHHHAMVRRAAYVVALAASGLATSMLLGTGAATAATTPSPDTADQASVPQIIAPGGSDVSEGSGFVIGKNLVMTNAHVVRGATSISAKFPGASGSVTCAVVRESSAAIDLAELSCATGNRAALTLQPTRTTGEAVQAIGYPFGGPQRVTHGTITSTKINSSGYISIDAAVDPGNSGGPVVDAAGAVLGIASAEAPSDRAENFAIPAETVTEFLAHSKLSPATPSIKQHSSSSDRPEIEIGGGVVLVVLLALISIPVRRRSARKKDEVKVVLHPSADSVDDDAPIGDIILKGNPRQLDDVDATIVRSTISPHNSAESGADHG